MKKNVFLATVLTVGVLGLSNVDAQINLLRTFEEWIVYYNDLDVKVYAIADNPIKIYNEDFSLRKSVTIDLPDDYEVFQVIGVSEKIFNTDNKLEFLVTFGKANTGSACFRLYNEDGIVIKDFGSDAAFASAADIYPLSNGEYRFSLGRRYDAGGSRITYEIYSLPVRMNISSTPIVNKATELSYKLRPGETATMKIYDARGRLIETKQVDYVFSKILLNTTNYSRGVYVYEINGLAKKFTVK